MTKCPICEKGILKKSKIEETMFGVYLGKFPAEVCSHCRESFTDIKTTKKIAVYLNLRKGEEAFVHPQDHKLVIDDKEQLVPLDKINQQALNQCTEARCVQEVKARAADYKVDLQSLQSPEG